MARERMIFETGEYIAKLPVGPTSSSPGPIFDRQEAAAVKFVARLWPSKEISSVMPISSIMYSAQNR